MNQNATEIHMHGSFMSINGKGVVITGQSGIGKSETTLELMDRGHKFIVDDGLIINKENKRLIGKSPKIIQNLIEVRGIGIIDVTKLYNKAVVLDSHPIDYICNLKLFSSDQTFDRLGEEEKFQKILGIKIPLINIPVSAARNTSILIEVAIKTKLLKEQGQDALKTYRKKRKNVR